MSKKTLGWSIAVIGNGLLWCVLGFDGTSAAAPQPGRPPFNNAVEQRGEMIRELQAIKALLQEQNRLLRTQLGQPATNESRQQ